MIFTVQAKASPPLNVINDRIIFPLASSSKFDHADYVASAIETIQKFSFQLLPTIYWTSFQVCVPIKGVAFQWSDKLLNKQITISASIIASFNKVSNMLPWIPIAIKLLKLWWLIIRRHFQHIKSKAFSAYQFFVCMALHAYKRIDLEFPPGL